MKIDKIRLPDHLNKRKKLTQAQKELIKKRYELGIVSMRGLAKEYNVNKRLIQFCVYPERYELAKARRRKAWAEGKYREHYNKEKHRKAMRDIRERKKKL